VMMQVMDDDNFMELVIPFKSDLPICMDLAIVLDTTASICDEIEFLQDKLANVISTLTTSSDDQVIDLHVAMVYYKDVGDNSMSSAHLDLPLPMLVSRN
jgi:hypothetical protein